MLNDNDFQKHLICANSPTRVGKIAHMGRRDYAWEQDNVG